MSDHNSSPRGVTEPAIDIGDLYVFPSPSRPGQLVLAMSVFPNESENSSKQGEVALFARSSQRMLLEEGNNLLQQLASVAHLKPKTETVIGPAIALDIDTPTTKEFA